MSYSICGEHSATAYELEDCILSLGIVISIVGSILLCLAWLSPFPLIHAANGDLSNEWNTLCVDGAVMSALPVSILAFWGINSRKWFLFAAGLLLGLLSWAAMLSNFV